MADWFEIPTIGTALLMQGQVLFDYRIPVNFTATADPVAKEADERKLDVIILTQSCDLQGRNGKPPRIRNVMLAPIYFHTDFENHPEIGQAFRSSTFKRLLREGHNPNLCMLGAFNDPCKAWPYAIVNFLEIMHTSFSEANLHFNQQTSKIRLKPPFREYLSQAIAKCFMRVAVDDDDRVGIDDSDNKFQESVVKRVSVMNSAEHSAFLALLNQIGPAS